MLSRHIGSHDLIGFLIERAQTLCNVGVTLVPFQPGSKKVSYSLRLGAGQRLLWTENDSIFVDQL